MEILAAVIAVEALKEKCRVVLYSDSQYLVNAMQQGWAVRWRANHWQRNKREKALNPDLWERLLQRTAMCEVEFRWVRGHAGDPENERCDQLAMAAARGADLAVDNAYEVGLPRAPR
jgi:ribonuclease HI